MPEEKGKKGAMSEIDKVTDQINEKYGNGEKCALTLDSDSVIEVPRYDLGSRGWNEVFGGGLPKGRVIEIAGAPSSGKTSSCYFLASQVQKQGGIVAWLDLEACAETDYMKAVGVDLSKLILVTPNNGEEAADMAIMYAKAGISLIVIDSLAALVPKAELEGEITDQKMALQARLLGKFLRMITPTIHKSGTTIVVINQMRAAINTGGFSHGPTSVSSGGVALKFFSSVRLETKRIQTLKDKDEKAIGIVLKVENKKNKCGLPFRSAEFQYMYANGFDIAGEALDEAISAGTVKQEGRTYSMGGEKLGVGRDVAKVAYAERLAEKKK